MNHGIQVRKAKPVKARRGQTTSLVTVVKYAIGVTKQDFSCDLRPANDRRADVP